MCVGPLALPGVLGTLEVAELVPAADDDDDPLDAATVVVAVAGVEVVEAVDADEGETEEEEEEEEEGLVDELIAEDVFEEMLDVLLFRDDENSVDCLRWFMPYSSMSAVSFP